MTAALSISRYADELLAGPARRGHAVAHGYALFDRDVLALTPPGAPRLPNGIETDVRLVPGDPLVVGDGELHTTTATITTGPRWDARPSPRIGLSVRPNAELDFARLAGWGPGLTPLGDDILVGYLAAAALAGSARPSIDGFAAATTALSRTFLSLAVLGELPEPAHRLLEDGEHEPLLRFGSTSGKGIIVGLAAATSAPSACRKDFDFTLPLPDGPQTFHALIGETQC